MNNNVAALFVDIKGVYPTLVHCCYGKELDARNYIGSLPVVAHPPCQLWVNFAHLNYKRWGGEHNRPGNDGGMFYWALSSVRRCGGVLEHPASSNAWSSFGLTRPSNVGWTQTASHEWVCEVWQSAYGHAARKKTWLFYCGRTHPLEARWDRNPGTHQVGWFDRKKPTLSKKESSRTPIDFAKYLISLAEHSRA